MHSEHDRKRLLLTGASGFLGQALLERLSTTYDVVGLGYAHAVAPIRTVDVRQGSALRALLEEICPDVVVHSAAYRDPDFCEANPEETRVLNTQPLQTLHDGLPETCPIVLISTDYVFDGSHPPYREEDHRQPINEYGRSKQAAEDIVLQRRSGLVLRIPLLMGVGVDFESSGFIAKMIMALRQGDALEWDDQTMRFPTDIRDVAAVVDFLLAGGHAGVCHFSGPRGQTQFGWARELAAMMDLPAATLKPVLLKREAARPHNSQLAMRRLEKLAFVPATDFCEVAGAILKRYA
jgi:dTDP-4-dehydrorhamnose reductase